MCIRDSCRLSMSAGVLTSTCKMLLLLLLCERHHRSVNDESVKHDATTSSWDWHNRATPSSRKWERHLAVETQLHDMLHDRSLINNFQSSTKVINKLIGVSSVWLALVRIEPFTSAAVRASTLSPTFSNGNWNYVLFFVCDFGPVYECSVLLNKFGKHAFNTHTLALVLYSLNSMGRTPTPTLTLGMRLSCNGSPCRCPCRSRAI